ncbi:MAG: glycosyltransferase family 4 protein [Planctomycetaceae bacterium]
MVARTGYGGHSDMQFCDQVRVIHVISGLFYGGGQRVVLDLLRELAIAGKDDVQLCCLGEHEECPLAAHRDVTIPYDGRYNSPAVLWKTVRHLRYSLRAFDFDIVHTHGVDADLIGALALQGETARHVCHLHITPPDRREETWKASLRRRVFRFATARKKSWFIAVSDFVRNRMTDYYELPPDRVVTVRNGVDLTEFQNSTGVSNRQCANRFVIGTAARLNPMKGLDFLIDAAAQLKQSGVPVELRIAGPGDYRETLERRAVERNLESDVRFLGPVNDMPAFYRSLDLFVLPSLSEGLPLVVLEAMACGTPVVATNVAGTPEVIQNEIDGLLVPPSDADALAVAVKRCIEDEALRRRFATAGEARVRAEFGTERVAREVSAVYRRMLNHG